LLESDYINLNIARLIVDEMIKSPKSPKEIADEKCWQQITDDTEITKVCKEMLDSEQGRKMTDAYKSGKTKVLFAIAGDYKFA
jgi:Asp-tRNA(Asn)/Glu-tRNA(Gln) amidotransferase B subunit